MGKTISIFMPDWDSWSVKICSFDNSIVKGFYIPRNKLKEASEREELKNPWIYFLFWELDELGKYKTYIWEAEVLINRLKQHNTSKDFWNVAICFISAVKKLNKAHIKYLENLAWTHAKNLNKCDLDNSINPTKSSLDEQEESFVKWFYDDMKILISTLWFPILDETKKEKSDIFFCKGKWALAKWEYTKDGIVVFKWSTVNVKEAPASDERVIWTRKKLIEKWILIQKWEYYEFSEDHTFSSPSTAAMVILARRANGRDARKDSNDNTLDERMRKK